MITRKSSCDSTGTYCSIAERKRMQMKKNNHNILKHIHSKVLKHIKMENILEPYEVHKFIELVKKLRIEDAVDETFRKKIRNMLLTINDSLMQFEQAVYSGEVTLYSVDMSQNCDSTQQSSRTSVGEVPSFSSIELTNTDFKTVPNNSQNCIELYSCENYLHVRNEEFTRNAICGPMHSKAADKVDKLAQQKITDIEETNIIKIPSNEKYFKNPMKKNVQKPIREIKISRSKKGSLIKKISNNKIQSSIQENRTTPRKRKYDPESNTSDVDQEIFSSELERLHLNDMNNRVVYETKIKYDQNAYKMNNFTKKIYLNKSNNLILNRKTKDNINADFNMQKCTQNVPLHSTNHVKKKYCVQYDCGVQNLNIPVTSINSDIKEFEDIQSKEYNNTNYIVDLIPETKCSLSHTENKEYFCIQDHTKKETNHLSNNSSIRFIKPKNISPNKESMNKIVIIDDRQNQEFIKNCELTQNTSKSLSSSVVDSTFSAAKNISDEIIDESYSNQLGEKSLTWKLEYNVGCTVNNISKALITSQELSATHNPEENVNTAQKINLHYKEKFGKELVPTSSNLLAIDGNIISQHWDIQYNSQASEVKKLDKENTNITFEFRHGNIKNLREKMALAKVDCISTWNKFVQALKNTKNDTQSLVFQEEEEKQFSEGYKHHYEAMENICNEYVKRFGSEEDNSENDDNYVSIEDKIKKWLQFQVIIRKIKEKRKSRNENL